MESNVILLMLFALTIDTVLRSVLKIKAKVFYCGLFGFCGTEKPNVDKLKILGLYNEKRGEHSCGLWYNSELIKGVDKLKLFSDFIQNVIITHEDTGSHVFIGHTRKATHGSHTEKNAHPFLVNDNLVLAHNGKIENIWTLCGQHGISFKDIDVDSLGLACIIEKDGFKVLEEYKGAVALLFQKLEEPNTLYVYHGASKTKETDKEEYEERPLFYMETREGIYLSSLKEALLAIRETDKETPETVPHNYVFKIEGGILNEEDFVEVIRGDINIEKPAPKVVQIWPEVKKNQPTQTESKAKVKPIIWDESIPNAAFEDIDMVYYNKGRYWQGDALCHGLVYINKRGKVVKKDDPGSVLYYFWNGVMLKSQNSYNTLKSISVSDSSSLSPEFNFAMFVSKYSKYPITNLKSEGTNVTDEYRYLWYADSLLVTQGFTPKFSNRNYSIRNGVFQSISCPDKKEAPLIMKTDAAINESPNPHGDCCETNLANQLADALKFAASTTEEELNGTPIHVVRAGDQALMFDGKGEPINNVYIQKEKAFNDKYPIGVQSVAKQLRKVYSTKDEIFAEVGCTALLALELYVIELHKEQMHVVLTKEQTAIAVEDHLAMCCTSNITLEEGMLTEHWVEPIEEYIKQAIEMEKNFGLEPILKEQFDQGEFYKLNVDVLKEDKKETEDEPEVLEDEENKLLDNSAAKDLIVENLSYELKQIEKVADDLQVLNFSDMAQDTCYSLYKKLDEIRIQIRDIGHKYNEQDVVNCVIRQSII